MIPITVQVKVDEVFAALQAAPATLDRYLESALDRAAIEVSNEAQLKAAEHDGFGTNRQAIHWETPSQYQRVVATGTEYAAYIEGGVKPNQPRMPNVAGLYPWVNQKFGALSVKEQDRMVYAIAKSIQRDGIEARPFMAPTAEKMADRCGELIGAAIDNAIAEIVGGVA